MKRIFQIALTLLTCAWLLVGCGGGGDPAGAGGGGESGGMYAGPGSGGTGPGPGPVTTVTVASVGGSPSYASGVVTSTPDGGVVVNGVHFDGVDGTQIINPDDPDHPIKLSDIKPGMMVQIEAEAITREGGQPHAKTLSIRLNSQVQGIVFTVNPANQVFTVLGMRVKVTPTTQFGDAFPQGLQSMKVMDIVEVYGRPDPDDATLLVATRVEAKPLADYYVLEGPVTKVTSGTLEIPNLPYKIDLQGLLDQYIAQVGGLEGSVVRMKFNLDLPKELLEYLNVEVDPATGKPAIPLSGSLSVSQPTYNNAGDTSAFLEGVVTWVDPSNPQVFRIDNVKVDAISLKTCEVCNAGIKVGQHLSVVGPMINLELEDGTKDGRLVALAVEEVEAVSGTGASTTTSSSTGSSP